MKNDERGEVPDREKEEAVRRKDMRRALTFGVVMATLQMAVLLYFVNC
jgi:hypothetical protein